MVLPRPAMAPPALRPVTAAGGAEEQGLGLQRDAIFQALDTAMATNGVQEQEQEQVAPWVVG